jgi:beta-galactosidase
MGSCSQVLNLPGMIAERKNTSHSMNTLFKPATRTRFRIPHFKLATAFCILTFVGFASDANAAPRERTLIDSGWRFQLGDPPDVLTNAAETNVTYYPEIPDLAKLQSSEVSGTTSETYMETLRADPVATHMGENVSVVKTNFNDSSWRSLNLPHDWAVELPFNSSADINHGYKPVGTGFSANSVGWYRRTFTLPANYAGQSLWLEFDGVYRNCLVWLNGHILGRNVGGYGSFYFDASQYANPGGTNVLVVRVDANRFEGWFYEGAGIYRHVWLTKTSPLHIEHWGTFVTNKITGGNALVTVRTTLDNSNASPANCTLTSTILDAQSNTVVSAVQGITIPAGTNQIVAQTVTITNAHLWSLNSPYLYQLVSTVTQAGVTNDVYQTPFGARTILLDATNGLFLNGQRVEIQGACNHQDHAGVGSAIPDRLQDFRIEKLKEMGCNALRTSHIGMLVLDENRRLGTNAEPLVELQRLVLRDRNHPCIFAWSLANEEPLQGWTPLGATIIQVMQNLAHQLDPTRLCTVAMNGNWGSGFSTVIDVQGFNYENNGNENSFHSSHPTIPAFATEEASTLTTRGIYADTSSYEQAYDVDIPSWGATAETWWTDYVAREPWNGGAFIWTGFDYRGEPTPFSWPDISSEFGSMDTCGFPKDNYYYYQANWSGKTVLHLLPHWNWSSGSISVWCFCNCDSVELFLNGASQGLQQVNVLGHAQWSVTYAAGTLSAVGYRDERSSPIRCPPPARRRRSRLSLTAKPFSRTAGTFPS